MQKKKKFALTVEFPMTGIQNIVFKFGRASPLFNSENVCGHLQVTEVVPICWKQVIMSIPHTNISQQHRCSTLYISQEISSPLNVVHPSLWRLNRHSQISYRMPCLKT